MKERPILFSGEMVRAILEGRKTQTRRIIKPQPPHSCQYKINGNLSHALCYGTGKYENICVPPTPTSKDHRLPCRYGKPGDRLWVRETWIHGVEYDENDMPIFTPEGNYQYKTWYRATDYELVWHDEDDGHCDPKWKPSIHMPRSASRILLEITAIRIERLQDISDDAAEAEGIEGWNVPTGGDDYQDYWRNYLMTQRQEKQGYPHFEGDMLASFKSLWESINGPESWAKNPWVWVIEFKKVENVTART